MGSLITDTPYSEITATLETLGRYGVEREHLTAVRKDKGLAERTARAFTGSVDGAKGTVYKHIFGSEYWLDFYSDCGVAFTKAQLREIEKFPFSLQVLEEPDPWETNLTVFETHFAFLGYKVSPLKWRELAKGPDHPKMWLDVDWYVNEAFAKKELEPRWYLNRIGIVPGSNGKLYEPDQLAMLSQKYYNPFATERVQTNILFRHINGVYLDLEFWARCQDKDSFGRRVKVRGDPVDGVGVDRWDGNAYPSIGVAASRKILDSKT